MERHPDDMPPVLPEHNGNMLRFDTEDCSPEAQLQFARGFALGQVWYKMVNDEDPFITVCKTPDITMIMRMCDITERTIKLQDQEDHDELGIWVCEIGPKLEEVESWVIQ